MSCVQVAPHPCTSRALPDVPCTSRALPDVPCTSRAHTRCPVYKPRSAQCPTALLDGLGLALDSGENRTYANERMIWVSGIVMIWAWGVSLGVLVDVGCWPNRCPTYKLHVQCTSRALPDVPHTSRAHTRCPVYKPRSAQCPTALLDGLGLALDSGENRTYANERMIWVSGIVMIWAWGVSLGVLVDASGVLA